MHRQAGITARISTPKSGNVASLESASNEPQEETRHGFHHAGNADNGWRCGPDLDSLSGMSKPQLEIKAQRRGIRTAGKTKAQLIAAIQRFDAKRAGYESLQNS